MAAIGTDRLLLAPQVSLFGLRQIASLILSSLLEGPFPLGVKGICPCSDFDVTADGCLRSVAGGECNSSPAIYPDSDRQRSSLDFSIGLRELTC